MKNSEFINLLKVTNIIDSDIENMFYYNMDDIDALKLNLNESYRELKKTECTDKNIFGLLVNCARHDVETEIVTGIIVEYINFMYGLFRTEKGREWLYDDIDDIYFYSGNTRIKYLSTMRYCKEYGKNIYINGSKYKVEYNKTCGVSLLDNKDEVKYSDVITIRKNRSTKEIQIVTLKEGGFKGLEYEEGYMKLRFADSITTSDGDNRYYASK